MSVLKSSPAFSMILTTTPSILRHWADMLERRVTNHLACSGPEDTRFQIGYPANDLGCAISIEADLEEIEREKRLSARNALQQ